MDERATARRPLIGIPVGRHLRSGRRNDDGQEYLRLRRTYPDAVVEAGGVPVLVPPIDDRAALRQLLSTLDGICFPGGLDVGPGQYGESEHPTTTVDDVLDTL